MRLGLAAGLMFLLGAGGLAWVYGAGPWAFLLLLGYLLGFGEGTLRR